MSVVDVAYVEPLAAPAASAPGRRRWDTWYVPLLVGSDIAIAAAAAMAVILASPGAERLQTQSALLPLAFALAWIACLGTQGAYSPRVLGAGTVEFRGVLHAGGRMLALAGLAAYLYADPMGRPLVLAGLPATVALTGLVRLGLRRVLQHMWLAGEAAQRVLLVGDEHAVDVAHYIDGQKGVGLKVVAACATEDSPASFRSAGIPVVGGLSDVPSAVDDHEIDVVLVVSGPGAEGEALRRLAWSLEGRDVSLLVAPGLPEVLPWRLSVRPVGALPFLHVAQPVYRGTARVVKSVIERGVAALGVLVILPVLASIALAIRATSPGPALFRQTRIGRRGTPFTCFKFRTMYVDAEARKAALAELNERGEGVLFKIRHDPRVTAVGRHLRRFSLDELPQLLNVVRGEMSLIGPRPPLPDEVERYEPDVHRRLLVKPGMTGLWQVSGRSDLTWEESVRLDLRYVENWSLAMDAAILWKTGRAVVTGSGAY